MANKNTWGRTAESQIKAVNKYNKENTTTFCLRCNLTTEKDIIRQLDRQSSKQGYIKNLIRKDVQSMKEKDILNYTKEIIERNPGTSSFGLVLILMDYCKSYNNGYIPTSAIELIEINKYSINYRNS